MDRFEVDQQRRRRSPDWVRAMSSAQLHATALKLVRESMTADLSTGQEWLWRALTSELEYRQRHPSLFGPRCACELCCSPFPDAD